MRDKLFLVVGASSGIGEQTAISLNQLGARVILLARREDRLKEIMTRMDNNGNAYYCFDVCSIDQIDGLVKKIVEKHGKLDGMVFAAGISDDCPLRTLTYQRELEVFNTNYFSFVEFVKLTTRKGRHNNDMRIVAVSSPAADYANKAHSTYAASKAAMNAAMRCMAKELGPRGICVNAVAPGWTLTDMTADFIEMNGEQSEIVKDLFKRQYLGMGKPVDIANAICFLLSPEARFITGTVLNVDGGYCGSE